MDELVEEAWSPRNPELWSVLEGLYGATRLFLTDLEGRPDELPTRTGIRLTDSTPSSTSWMTVEEVDWAEVVWMALQSVRRDSLHEQAEAILSVDPIIQPFIGAIVFAGWSGTQISPEACITGFLTDLFARKNEGHPSEEDFQAAYREFEEFFTRPTIPYRAIAPLEGFAMEEPELELISEIRIVELSITERERLLLHGMNSVVPSGPADSGSAGFAVEVHWEEQRLSGTESRDGRRFAARTQTDQSLDDVLSALRLYKGGAVWNPRRYYWPRRWIPFRRLTGIPGTSAYPPQGGPYRLAREESQPFLSFWLGYRKQQALLGQRLRIAHSRLEAGYDRRRTEDRVIDCVVGLEALLQPEDAKTELSYRVSLRGATLLSRTPQERETIFTAIRRAYDLRSAIVHGDDPEKVIRKFTDGAEPAGYLESLEDLLRRTIRAWTDFRGGMGDKEASRALDLKIIRGEPHPVPRTLPGTS